MSCPRSTFKNYVWPFTQRVCPRMGRDVNCLTLLQSCHSNTLPLPIPRCITLQYCVFTVQCRQPADTVLVAAPPGNPLKADEVCSLRSAISRYNFCHVNCLLFHLLLLLGIDGRHLMCRSGVAWPAYEVFIVYAIDVIELLGLCNDLVPTRYTPTDRAAGDNNARCPPVVTLTYTYWPPHIPAFLPTPTHCECT